MTRDTQRAHADHDDAAILSALWTAAPFPELPPDAPAQLKAFTIDVDDPRKVYTIYHASRRHHFQLLVERYIIQLRFGCQSKHCTTATCFTCRKRISGKVPLRRYSPTSARTLACYMASQDNPEAGLCPHVLSVPLTGNGSTNIKFATKTTQSGGQSTGNGTAASGSSSGSRSKAKVPLKASEIWQALEETYSPSKVDDDNNEIRSLHDHLLDEPKKDHKSFIQTLYNTVSMRMLEWLTPGGFDALQTTHRQNEAKKIEKREETAAKESISRAVTPSEENIPSKPSWKDIRTWDDLMESSRTSKLDTVRSSTTSPIVGSPSETASSDDAPQANGLSSSTSPPDGTLNASISPTNKHVVASESSSIPLSNGHVKSAPKKSNPAAQREFATAKLPQSLKILNIEIICFLCDTMQVDGTAEQHLLHPPRMPITMRSLIDVPFERRTPMSTRDTRRQWKLFIQQSLFYILSDPQRALESFTRPNSGSDQTLLDTQSLWYCMVRLTRVEPSLVFHSLWMATESLFAPPPQLDMEPEIRDIEMNRRGLGVRSAAQLIWIALSALIAAAPLVENPAILTEISRSRSRSMSLAAQEDVDLSLHYMDTFSDELALRLAKRVFAAIPTQTQFQELERFTNTRPQTQVDFIKEILEPLCFSRVTIPPVLPFFRVERAMHTVRFPTLTIDWARTVMIQTWDGSPVVPLHGPFGGALAVLSAMYEQREELQLSEILFRTEYFEERLDQMTVPTNWLGFVQTKKTTHLLNYAFLFRPATLVSYFRAINFSRMNHAHELACTKMTQVGGISSPENPMINPSRRRDLYERLQTAVSKYFVLKISRENVLKDAFDQIWRRQERELVRPLKIRLGEDEGEEGSDSGGVQQEFFRLAIAEALNPDAGLFTVDDRTKMTWFLPGSPEPLWKYELIGVLFSLAVYNGLTLPVTFPKVFYQKLLGNHSVSLSQISDGWPELCAGFTALLDWDSSLGSVADVFARTYEFSVDSFGELVSRDMSKSTKWPQFGDHHTENPPDAKMVTEENREEYVHDYISWLTDISILPQYAAFERGFYTVVDRKSVSFFAPETFQSLVEGTQTISIQQLKRFTRYVGWDADHPIIENFWRIVEGYDLDMKRKLLEFVTASDRVPVGGMSGLQFVIQRNGEGDTRLPSAYTCYGTLLLPEYNSMAALREKLGMALENAKGFGFA